MPEVNIYCTDEEKLKWGLEEGEFENTVGTRPREFYEPFFRNRGLRERYKKILSENGFLTEDEMKEFIIEGFEFFIKNYFSSLLETVDFEVYDTYHPIESTAYDASRYCHSLFVEGRKSLLNPMRSVKKNWSSSNNLVTDLFRLNQLTIINLVDENIFRKFIDSMQSLYSFFEYAMRDIFYRLSMAFIPDKNIPLWNGEDKYEYLYLPWHYSRSIKSSLPFKPIYYRCPLVYGTVLYDTTDYFPFFLLNKGAFRAFVYYEDLLNRALPYKIKYEKKITVPNLYERRKGKPISNFSFNVVVNHGLMIYPLMHGYVVGDQGKIRLLKPEDANAFVNGKLFLSVEDFLPFDYYREI